MNVKVFSILVAIFIAVIALLGGTYYYLFEYSATSNTPNYSYSNTTENYKQNTPQNTQEQTSIPLNVPSIDAQRDLNEQNTSSTQENTPVIEEQNSQNVQENLKTQIPQKNEKEQTQTEKISENKNTPKSNKDTNPLKLVSNSQKTKGKLSTIKEYQQRGKDSRLEPQLSSETLKVYVVDGKALSDYRINLLKDMLEPVQNRSKDYNLSVFIEMLPQSEMSVTIYNKDIIFSDRKKSYKHISMDKLKPYLNEPENINKNVKREEVIERVNFQIKTDAKGSHFSKHIKSLKNGLDKAQYFFPFCEIIQIDSKK
ncbi:hypothetical protein [Campylobacter cuniculorum]|uniref:Periplasmic protein n=2 Tax=Campylobacter cuniculorum TaxID=374106 RepID=A0A1W6BWP3_9BACT|nr:hypothetical protein [Campylobacter cuniculorum]ARJ56502.1 hypothetical protein (OmpA/MotB domain) [Campylobacter cuniculorum DSM 23162 = LMG 24588]QOR03986.1 hypothetical protein A0071_07390 [Campylobacter cuniculorum]